VVEFVLQVGPRLLGRLLVVGAGGPALPLPRVRVKPLQHEALTTAAEHHLKLACLVELFGALPREYHGRVKDMPPTLLIHGDADSVVPVEEAYLLAGLLVARKQRHEVEVLAGAEHMFLRGGKELRRWPLPVPKLKTDAFLKLHLREERVTKAKP
jgi:dienelactone hydrolase